MVEDGVRGMQQTGNDPLPGARRLGGPSDAQIIEDTLREETGGTSLGPRPNFRFD